MYSEKVMDHFNHPRNVGEMENPSGVGTVGNAKCGDIMRMYLDIDDNGIIQEAKFKTFGCGAAGWRAVAIICALIGLVVNTISCLAVKEVEPDESVRKMIDESKPQDDKLGFWESMKFLFTNKYYVLILVLYIVYYIMSNITTGSGVYFTKYVLGDPLCLVCSR